MKMSKKFTKKQKQWLSDYQHHTGFEPDYSENDFDLIAHASIRAWKNYSEDILNIIETDVPYDDPP